MNITITHTLSPEVIELFKGLLKPLSDEPIKEPAKKEKQALKAIPATDAPELPETKNPEISSASVESQDVSLETVRALVNEKAQTGEKQKTSVKNLLKEFGADKLTALDATHYSAFYQRLQKIA